MTAVFTIDQIRQTFAPVLREGHAKKAIVFGSYGRAEADEYSDLDLIIVADSNRTFFRRHEDFAELYEIWRRGFDPLIYTPAEFAAMQSQGNPFIERALGEGVIIYEE